MEAIEEEFQNNPENTNNLFSWIKSKAKLLTFLISGLFIVSLYFIYLITFSYLLNKKKER